MPIPEIDTRPVPSEAQKQWGQLSQWKLAGVNNPVLIIPWENPYDRHLLSHIERILSDHRVRKFLFPTTPYRDPNLPINRVKTFIISETLGNGGTRWSLYDPRTDRILGFTKLRRDRHNPLAAERGIVLDPDSWGQGLGIFATTAMTWAAFACGLTQVYSCVRPDNDASNAMNLRLMNIPWVHATGPDYNEKTGYYVYTYTLNPEVPLPPSLPAYASPETH